MADELQIIPQPDAVPSAVSTGYTRQNTIAEGTYNGLDCSAPYGTDTDEVTLPVGGPVDINGVLFSITSAATLSGISAGTDYYIYLAAGSDADHYTPTLTTNAGTFDASKNARYTAGGDRILNWKLRGDGVGNVVCTRIGDPQNVSAVSDQGTRECDSPTFEDLMLDGHFYPTDSPTIGSQAVGTSYFTLPRGEYNIRLPARLKMEMYLSGTGMDSVARNNYGTSADADQGFFHVYSDGSNIRFIAYVGSMTLYYMKF